jgi:hypothetical protein
VKRGGRNEKRGERKVKRGGRVSTILVYPVFSRICQYMQYWYNQYFPEYFSICNTGITSTFQNLPVSAILVVHRETGRKETRAGRKEKREEEKEGREKGEARSEILV